MKKVILVGNCELDGPQMKSVIENNYDAEVRDVKTMDEAEMIIDNEDLDLILVNRVGDKDGRNGLELVDKVINNDRVPIILITNYQDKMEEAVLHGAMDGFGKEDILGDGLENVKKVLDPILTYRK